MSDSQKDLDRQLMLAILKAETERVVELLKAGANPNHNDDNNYPLNYACSQGGKEIVRILLEAGADPNPTYQGDEYDTPLHDAVWCDPYENFVLDSELEFELGERVEMVRMLLKAGANPHVFGNKCLGMRRATPLGTLLQESSSTLAYFERKVEEYQDTEEGREDYTGGFNGDFSSYAEEVREEIAVLLLKFGAEHDISKLVKLEDYEKDYSLLSHRFEFKVDPAWISRAKGEE